MAKKTVKKASTKKAAAKKGKKTSVRKKAGSSAAKTKVKPKAKTKVKAKKPLSDKEKLTREANVIANAEKKKKLKGKRPKKNATSQETSSLLDAIVDGMQEKKARNITILDLTGLDNRVSDFFVICDAESRTQVEAIADSVEDVVQQKTSEKPYHAEGFENAEWILIDYINIVAHVFQKDSRDYYNIEGLWADAEIQVINN